MSLSDRFKAMLKKNDGEPAPQENAGLSAAPPGAAASVQAAPSAAPSPTLEEIDRLIAQERRDGEARLLAMENEVHAIRAAMEKSELATKNKRDAQQQTLQFLQQDAEREIKFLERKLQEDISSWNRQLTEREKAIEQTSRQSETQQLEKKVSYEKAEDEGKQILERSEQLLKEQEAKLAQERQKWRETLEGKDADLLALKQELSRRESELQAELQQQDAQRKAEQELWQARLSELERQGSEKRKSWEEAMKAKEEERLRIHATFQERQAAWQLDQERRLQEISRRQERASEKVAALKAHLVKET